MDIPARKPRGQASDSLLLQIDIDNVMQAYRFFECQAHEMLEAQRRASALRDIPACAEDPISLDAVAVFQPKIDAIADVHAAYVTEILEARDRLREAAQQYGLIDAGTAGSFGSARSAPQAGRTVLER